jgi:hypothetical protein
MKIKPKLECLAQQLLAVAISSMVIGLCFTSACAETHANPAPNAGLGDMDALRIERDRARDRVWMLKRDGVYLYDGATRWLIRRFELPEWRYAPDEYACPPDLVIDAAGSAIVSSNVVPMLWRIAPRSAEAVLVELRLDKDTDKDVGFTALLYANQRTLIGASSPHGSLWVIDLASQRAKKVNLAAPIRGVCALGLKVPLSRHPVVCAPSPTAAYEIEIDLGRAQAAVTGSSCLR